MAHKIMGMKIWSMGAMWLVLDVLTHPTHAFLASPMAHLSVQTRPAFSSSLLPGHARSRAASSPARSRAAAISVLASARAETVGDILIVGGGPRSRPAADDAIPVLCTASAFMTLFRVCAAAVSGRRWSWTQS